MEANKDLTPPTSTGSTTAPNQAGKTTKAANATSTVAQPATFRADHGEGVPTPPIKTATDNEE
jgi:hypothetical protein